MCVGENGITGKNPFAHRKRKAECRSLWDAFSGNIIIIIVYKWCHSDVMVIKLTADTAKPIFRIFHILKN